MLGLLCALGLAADRPNVVLVIADDLNCDVGCYGGPAVTPHLDGLAARGVRFDRAYVQYPVCNPSRTSFLTGLRPDATGVWDNATPVRTKLPAAVTLPDLFRQNGYFTASLGKVFHRVPKGGDPGGWDHTHFAEDGPAARTGAGRNLTGGKLAWCRWQAPDCGDDDLADGRTAAEAERLIGTSRAKPFFLAVGFHRPHDPFVAPRRYFDRYDPARLPEPAAATGFVPPSPLTFGGGAFADAFARFTAADRREFRHAYLAGTSYTDAQLGRVLAALTTAGVADRTVVVFVGDHGYELGVRGWWNKNTLYERSCRTPFVVFDPQAAGNGRPAAGLTEFVDLYPTLADRCRLTGVPANLAGESLVPRLADPARPGKPAAHTVVRRGDHVGRSVRTDRWRFTDWPAASKGKPELYDHAADPQELVNLAADPAHADTVRTLRGSILRPTPEVPR
jgi:uncharacterized sulfatase